MKELRGNFSGKGKKIVVVVSRFNEFISTQLLQGCLDTLDKSGVTSDNILVIWTPGAFEIPQVLSKLDTKKFSAAIALGAVIRGDTPHFDYIASETAKGIAQVCIATGVPAIFGIITADSIDQAIERAGTKDGNKGRDAASSAIEMANLVDEV